MIQIQAEIFVGQACGGVDSNCGTHGTRVATKVAATPTLAAT
jgi:hypothetical protein